MALDGRVQGLPAASCPTRAKADERETLVDLLPAEPALAAARPGQTLIRDKNNSGVTSSTNSATRTSVAPEHGPSGL